jgi:hypothetical protein
MDNEYNDIKMKWLECTCSHVDHAIRLSYSKEFDWFSIEFKLYKSADKKIRFYFKNLFNALLAKENVYMSHWSGDLKQAKEFKKFLEENT